MSQDTRYIWDYPCSSMVAVVQVDDTGDMDLMISGWDVQPPGIRLRMGPEHAMSLIGLLAKALTPAVRKDTEWRVNEELEHAESMAVMEKEYQEKGDAAFFVKPDESKA